jgi:4-amino-4-deoxy-L-arabinose transferase-like glycosyltransferase
LVLLLSLALGRAFRWWRDGHTRDASAALALVGLGALAKGPVAPALFVAVLGGFLAWQRDLGRLRRIVTPVGLAAFVVLGLGWYAIALAGWGDLFVHEHLVGRYVRNLVGGLASGGPYSPKPLRYHLLFYPLHLPLIALPWTPIVALALWRAWRADGLGDPRLRFLLCWTLAPVVVFTPAEWKLRYYLLPAVPALALTAAPTVIRLLSTPPRWGGSRATIAVAALVLVATVGVLLATPRLPLSSSDRETVEAVLAVVPGGRGALVATLGFVLGVVIAAAVWRAWAAAIGLTTLATLAWMAFGTPAVEQAVSRRDSLKPFALAVATRHPRPDPVAFWGETIRAVAVYVGRPVPRVGRNGLTPGVAVIVRERDLGRIARLGVLGVPVEIAEGRTDNTERGRVVLLDVIGRSAGTSS